MALPLNELAGPASTSNPASGFRSILSRVEPQAARHLRNAPAKLHDPVCLPSLATID
jgi:hypothetical protein